MEYNPYKPPGSELVDTSVWKRSRLWRLYFFIISLLYVFDAYTRVVSSDFGGYDFFSVMANATGVVGLYGYTYSKKIFSSKFWVVSSFFVVTEAIVSTYIMDLDMFTKSIGLFISTPMYVAIFLYGWLSSSLWSSA